MLEEYLSEKQKRKRRRRRFFLGIAGCVILFALLLLAVWIVTESPFFQVHAIVIQGNHVVASSDIMMVLQGNAALHQTFWPSFLGENNILFWPNAVASSVLAAVPQLGGLAIEKNYTDHDIVVTATERQPFAIWCAMPPNDTNGNPTGNESCFWFDDTGTLFAEAFDTEGNEIFAVHDYSGSPIVLGGTILPDIFVQNMISIMDVLKKSGLVIQNIAVNNMELQEVDVTTYNGPTIYFSLRFDAEEDLPVLTGLMAQPNFDTLHYIDFRTENRAYYE